MDIDTGTDPYQPFGKVCILAPGLLGASVAMACKKNRVAQTTHIWSRRASSRAKLIGQPWCDEIFASPGEAAEEADLVVICSPVDFIVPLYNEIRQSMKPGALVTDVGSTKSLICRQIHAAADPRVHFIGAHPMAGSEKTSMDYACDSLFHNRPCIITPLEDSNEIATKRIIQFWKSIGAVTFIKTPEDHDEIVAHISHLPHLIAASLCQFLDKHPSDWEQLTSTGLRETTRIASGDPGMWKAIIETNREEIKRALSGYQDDLQRIQSALTNGNMVELVSILEKGKNFRDRLN
ncbi:MAG: prephenate dehydrogenase/arogenate dehydrogenase family protein [Verrucomicrobia bacterium]|nr:prephenate dehydrogenase/arogenate dehydrogenase family protein [Verrucomicrobiota bacterium]